TVGQLAGIGFGVSNNLRDGLQQLTRAGHQNRRLLHDIDDRREVAGLVPSACKDQRIEIVVRSRQHQRAAVRWRFGNVARRDIAGGANAVVYDDRSPSANTQTFGEDTRQSIRSSTWGEANDDALSASALLCP